MLKGVKQKLFVQKEFSGDKPPLIIHDYYSFLKQSCQEHFKFFNYLLLMQNDPRLQKGCKKMKPEILKKEETEIEFFHLYLSSKT